MHSPTLTSKPNCLFAKSLRPSRSCMHACGIIVWTHRYVNVWQMHVMYDDLWGSYGPCLAPESNEVCRWSVLNTDSELAASWPLGPKEPLDVCDDEYMRESWGSSRFAYPQSARLPSFLISTDFPPFVVLQCRPTFVTFKGPWLCDVKYVMMPIVNDTSYVESSNNNPPPPSQSESRSESIQTVMWKPQQLPSFWKFNK